MPGKHRRAEPTDSLAGQASRFGVRAAFQLGLAARLHGQAAQPVRDQEDDFGFARLLQLPKQVVKGHAWSVPKETAAGYRRSA